MVGPPHWPHWILVGKIQCGSLTFRWRITRRDFSPSGPGPEVLARARNIVPWGGRVESTDGTLRRLRHVLSFFTP